MTNLEILKLELVLFNKNKINDKGIEIFIESLNKLK